IHARVKFELITAFRNKDPITTRFQLKIQTPPPEIGKASEGVSISARSIAPGRLLCERSRQPGENITVSPYENSVRMSSLAISAYSRRKNSAVQHDQPPLATAFRICCELEP